MKLLNLKRMHCFWFAPVAAIAMLWAFASIGSSPVNSICGSNGLEESGSIPGCNNQSGDSRRTPVGPEQALNKQVLDDESQSLGASVTKPGAPRYSEYRIRMLNEMMPVPDAAPVLLREIERLSLQQRRFERRYGPESVAARSVRLRLRDLHDHVSSGMQYAVEDKREAVEDR